MAANGTPSTYLRWRLSVVVEGSGLPARQRFCEGAEDGRLDTRPIEPAGLRQGAQFVSGQRDNGNLRKQPAVEVIERHRPEVAAITHGRQQVVNAGRKALGLAHGACEEVRKEPARQ
jgi:hypothetical protein